MTSKPPPPQSEVDAKDRRSEEAAAQLPKLWTEKAAAAELGVHPETLRRERRAGRLAFTRIGNRVRYTAAHIAAYLELMECASTAKPLRRRGSDAPTTLDARGANRAAREIAGLPEERDSGE